MPIIPSPTHGGWIRVSPPRRSPQKQRAEADAALRGPLAYFSCQPVPTKQNLPPCPKYDIDDDGIVSMTKKDRTVSAPAVPRRRRANPEPDHGYDDYAAEEQSDYDDHHHHHHHHNSHIHDNGHRRSPPSRERSRPAPHDSPSSTHRSPTQAHPHPRATSNSNYWTGPTKKHNPGPRSYTSSQSGSTSSGGSRSTVSARWANATAPLDLG